ncbi:MAG: type II secretion system protein GspE, partial [Desulfobacterales bacterium]|nr:type II secretion system protein GspE [Desulfobacterales bacterium]
MTRLIEMGVEHYLVSSTLIGVIAQRLVRKICTNCRESIPVPDELRAEIGNEAEHIWHGKGCDQCMNTGYRGRVAIFELLIVDDVISNLIGARASVREIRDTARKRGMRTLREDGVLKVA